MSRPINKKTKEEFIEDAYASVQQGCSIRGRGACRCFREEIQGEKNSSACGVSVRRTAKGLEYNCFKASCELGGGIIDSGDQGHRRPNNLHLGDVEQSNHGTRVSSEFGFPADCQQAESEPAYRWLSQFTVGVVEIARYGLSERRSDKHGLYFPIRGIDGDYRGYLRRSLEERTQEGGEELPSLKWLTRCPPGEVYLSSPWKRNKIVFLVEDAPSVIRLGKNGFNALGLLGTSIRKEQLPNIMKLLVRAMPPKVIVALDPDATDKAKKIAGDLTTYWQGVKAITTTKDPKWWTDEEVERVANA
jgi:hypothetical protein